MDQLFIVDFVTPRSTADLVSKIKELRSINFAHGLVIKTGES